MKKPEKKEIIEGGWSSEMVKGYNQACDEWEKFLPSEEEIGKIAREKIQNIPIKGQINPCNAMYLNESAINGLAKAIWGRINGK